MHQRPLSLACSLLAALLLTGCAVDLRSSPQAQLRLSPNPGTQSPSATLLPESLPATLASTLAPASGQNGIDAEDELEEQAAAAGSDEGIVIEIEGEDPAELDPETLEDNAVLQANGVIAPDEEGETVFLDTKEFDFPVVDNEKVRYFVDYFSGRAHKVVRTWLERSSRYLPMMQEVFAEAGLPRDLVYLAMIESGFNNKAFSRAKASGQWQFIEGTGRRYGLGNDWWRDERRDPEKATRAAARHLSDLYQMFDGDWYLALAAYNAGAGKIKKAINLYGTRDFWQLTHGSYLKPETKDYVPKMLAGLLIAKHPERYGFTDLASQEPLAYEVAEVDSVVDLEVVAKLTDSDYETVKKLNPELKRWSTPPGAERYQLRLPVGSGALFAERYAQLPKEQRANFVIHKIRKGDTPAALAKRYGVRTDELLSVNKLRNARSLRVGQNLLIPLNPEAGKMSLADLREALRDDAPAGKPRSGGSATYTVKRGDSLWSIARRLSVSEQQLRSWNNLGSKAALKPGQKLVVAGTAKPQAKAKPAARQAARGQTQKIVYQVRPGDSLWTISRQFAIDVQQIRDWNRLSGNSVLSPGQRLTLLVKSSHRG